MDVQNFWAYLFLAILGSDQIYFLVGGEKLMLPATSFLHFLPGDGKCPVDRKNCLMYDGRGFRLEDSLYKSETNKHKYLHKTHTDAR